MKGLIAEDDPISRRVLEANLVGWGYDVKVASDGSEAWELIQAPDAPNLVVSDWMMPHMDGLELCRRIRQMERPGYTYLIILTAKGEKEDVIKGLEAGADDFLVKPFNRQELKYRTKIGERIINLELKILELANTDALTGVLNRRAFMERMKQEVQRSLREKAPLSLIMVDIDYFKKVNDSHGHQVGDLVLKRFAERLCEFSRPYDFSGRYGGEEFVLCLPGADISQAGSVAERMRGKVEEMKIELPDGSQSIHVTGSFGVACFRTVPEDSIDVIIGRADDSMYRAKRTGRNRVCTASEVEESYGRKH